MRRATGLRTVSSFAAHRFWLLCLLGLRPRQPPTHSPLPCLHLNVRELRVSLPSTLPYLLLSVRELREAFSCFDERLAKFSCRPKGAFVTWATAQPRGCGVGRAAATRAEGAAFKPSGDAAHPNRACAMPSPTVRGLGVWGAPPRAAKTSLGLATPRAGVCGGGAKFAPPHPLALSPEICYHTPVQWEKCTLDALNRRARAAAELR